MRVRALSHRQQGLALVRRVRAAALRLAGAALLGCSLASAFGCASIPHGAAAVDRLSIQGNAVLSSDVIERRLATSPSPKFLGLFAGFMNDYRLFDRHVFDTDLERVLRTYRAHGYYDAKVRAGRVVKRSEDHVNLTIVVEEGKPLHIARIDVRGLDALSLADREVVEPALGDNVRVGKRFEEEAFAKAEQDIERALQDRGYAYAKITRTAELDLPGHFAILNFEIDAGPRSTFGPITLEGLGPLPEKPVRRALDIVRGERYSAHALEQARQALLELGTFSSVEITPVLTDPPPKNAEVPLEVRVRKLDLRSIELGGGVELDPIRTEAHLHAVFETGNFLGGLRHLSIGIEPGFDLYPTRLPSLAMPSAILPEERFRVELRQPGFIEARTNGFLRAELDAYPVLLTPDVDPAAPVVGYFELIGSAGVDRSYGPFYTRVTYGFQYDRPFAYLGTLDPALTTLVISYVDLLARVDLRDDAIRPHRGIYLENDLAFAGGLLGGNTQDIRVQPEARAYVPLSEHTTLALRSSVGFLFPKDYGSVTAANGAPPEGEDRTQWVHDIERVYFRGFFSGGPSSNRGYPLRGVGPHGIVPFFNPGLAAQALAQACLVSSATYDPVRCAVPLGGLSLWEASVELRFPIQGALSGATFCDSSDVSPNELELRLTHPHLSCGVGLRYATPIGPARLDIGYRIPGLQVLGGENPLLEGDPGTILGLPVAVAFGIGEAF